jgi:hypothetical protein
MTFNIINDGNQTEVVSVGLTTYEVHWAFITKKLSDFEFLIISDGGDPYRYSDFKERYPIE